jgi:predicted esterase
MNLLHPLDTAIYTGTPVSQAQRAVIFLHGRGSSAQDILMLSRYLVLDGVAGVAPQATGHTWYPTSFLQPEARNQPHLDAALKAVQGLSDGIAEQGIPPTHQVLLGFSQGACLALEFVARKPQR